MIIDKLKLWSNQKLKRTSSGTAIGGVGEALSAGSALEVVIAVSRGDQAPLLVTSSALNAID